MSLIQLAFQHLDGLRHRSRNPCRVLAAGLGHTRTASAAGEGGQLGGTAARAMLRGLIDGEDQKHPLSDQKLCQEMARLGCPVSRRTVAKYREEMDIPGASGRKTL